MFVIRKKLAATDITPGNVRWNEDCSCVQQTFDGGDTWVDAPGQDPRSSDAFRAPALTTSDPRCDAAANMLAKLRAAVDMAIAFDNSVRLAGELFALFALAMPALGVVVAVFTIIADVLLALGAAAIEGAFTDDVYDRLLCVFFDNIDSDGQMSDAQLSDIYTQIAADFDVTVQAVFGAVSSAAGAVGWSNAGSLGHEMGDCTSCAEWCYTFDFSAGLSGWSFFVDGSTTLGTEVGTGLESVFNHHGADYEIVAITRTFTGTVTKVDMTFSYTAGFCDGVTEQLLYVASQDFVFNTISGCVAPTSPSSYSGGGHDVTSMFIQLIAGVNGSGGDPGGVAIIETLTFHGTGDNPFGTDNC